MPVGAIAPVPASNRPRDSAAQSLRSPRQGNAQIAGNNYVGGVQGTWGQQFFVKSPTDRPHRRGPRRRRKQTKNSHGTKAYSSKKAGFSPLHASPRRRLSRCGNRIVGATRERPEEGTKSLVGGRSRRPGNPAAAWHWPASLGFWAGELSPLGNRARWSEVGDCRAGSSGRLFACLCRGGSIRWVAWLGGSSYLLIFFSCCCDDG